MNEGEGEDGDEAEHHRQKAARAPGGREALHEGIAHGEDEGGEGGVEHGAARVLAAARVGDGAARGRLEQGDGEGAEDGGEPPDGSHGLGDEHGAGGGDEDDF